MSDTNSIISKHDEQCKSAIAALKRDFQKVRSGRASSGLLEGIVVDYYGSRTPLNKLAQISTPEARLIVVQVYDAGAGQAVEKAIQSSDLGLNPNREGNVIRVQIPSLTEQTRKDLARHLHKLAEEVRVSVRTHRRDANDHIKKLEKDSDITKDDSKRAQDKIQKQTDAYIAQIDQTLTAKEAELMEV